MNTMETPNEGFKRNPVEAKHTLNIGTFEKPEDSDATKRFLEEQEADTEHAARVVAQTQERIAQQQGFSSPEAKDAIAKQKMRIEAAQAGFRKNVVPKLVQTNEVSPSEKTRRESANAQTMIINRNPTVLQSIGSWFKGFGKR